MLTFPLLSLKPLAMRDHAIGSYLPGCYFSCTLFLPLHLKDKFYPSLLELLEGSSLPTKYAACLSLTFKPLVIRPPVASPIIPPMYSEPQPHRIFTIFQCESCSSHLWAFVEAVLSAWAALPFHSFLTKAQPIPQNPSSGVTSSNMTSEILLLRLNHSLSYFTSALCMSSTAFIRI